MKKILFGLLATLLVACHNDEITISPQDGSEKAELTVSVKVPEAASASARSLENPAITSLYLVVFDDMGYLVESVQATPVNSFAMTGETAFKVTLTKASSKRIIHFVANYDASSLSYGAESAVIRNMTVDGKEDAYWQRIELPLGITNNDATVTAMTKVPLLRNFVKVDVASSANNFELEGFTVINTWSKGSVAPYYGGGFADFVNGNNSKTYTEISAAGYKGFTPQYAVLENNTIGNSGDGGLNFDMDPFYMYERSHQSDNHTYVLIKGKYNGASSSYYKIDLVYTNSSTGATEYYNLLRNFCYTVNLNEVFANGKSTAKEAADMSAAHNNLSASVETQSLLNISDGEARFFVSFTDTTLVNTDPIVLKYQYVPSIASMETVANSSVNTAEVTSGGDVISSATVSTSDVGKWRSITIYPNSPNLNEVKRQSVTLVAGKLSRTVNFTLRAASSMTVECDPGRVSREIGSSVDVNISIPDDLPETLFPLTFFIESSELSIYPDANKDYMPVHVRNSVIPGQTDKSSFGYDKTLTYEEYEGLSVYGNEKTLTCYFKTNKKASASTVYVYNKYFEMGYDAFDNPEAQPLNLTIAAANLRATGISYVDDKTFTIYTDTSYNNELGSCSFSYKNKHYELSKNLTLAIPEDITVLYFVYKSLWNTYVASISVADLKLAANGTMKTLSFSNN